MTISEAEDSEAAVLVVADLEATLQQLETVLVPVDLVTHPRTTDLAAEVLEPVQEVC